MTCRHCSEMKYVGDGGSKFIVMIEKALRDYYRVTYLQTPLTSVSMQCAKGQHEIQDFDGNPTITVFFYLFRIAVCVFCPWIKVSLL